MSYLLQTAADPGIATWTDAGTVYFRNGSATSTVNLAPGESTEVTIAVGSAQLGEPVVVGWYNISAIPVNCRFIVSGSAILNNVILTIANVGTDPSGPAQLGFNVRTLRQNP